jgi:hypothetical protein
MVQDIRNVILSLDEVHSAFVCYQRISPGFLPRDTIAGCRTGENAVILTVDIAAGTTRQRGELTFKGIDVLKPLIRFCIENNIMLPRDGRKSIIIEPDRIMLHIELDLDAEMPASLSPLQMNNIDLAMVRAAASKAMA